MTFGGGTTAAEGAGGAEATSACISFSECVCANACGRADVQLTTTWLLSEFAVCGFGLGFGV